MKLPSKELLNEVLGNIAEIYEIKIVNNTLFYNTGYINEINIYELAHKCKEWAWLKYSITVMSNLSSCDLALGEGTHKSPFEMIHFSKGNTEFEAIVDACNWILKQGISNEST